MSVYAYNTKIDGDLVTLVPAADTVEELNKWWDTVHNKETQGYLTEAGLDHLIEDELNGYTLPVCVFPHNDEKSRENFIIKYDLVEVGNYVAIDRQKDMVAERDYEANLAAEKADTRTLAEITGTDKDDEWDKQASEADISVMKGAPEGVTGDGSLGDGTLKKTKEAVAREKEDTILEKAGEELKSVMVHLASLNIDLDTVMAMVDELELDDDVSVILKKTAKDSTPIDKVHATIDASEEVLSEVRKAMKKCNEVATDEAVIGIIGNREDAEGNVHITATVATERDKKRWAKERKQDEAKQDEAQQEHDVEKDKIREAAAAVGINADLENTYTGLKDDGTVIQRNDRLGIATTVSPDGDVEIKDVDTGAELTKKEIRAKELEADLKDLEDINVDYSVVTITDMAKGYEADEFDAFRDDVFLPSLSSSERKAFDEAELKKNFDELRASTGSYGESKNPSDWVYALFTVTNPWDISDDTEELGVYVAMKDDHCWDQSCPISALYDDPFSENSEGFHSSTLSVEDTRTALNKLGLVEDDEFGDHINDCCGVVKWHKAKPLSRKEELEDELKALTTGDYGESLVPSDWVYTLITSSDTDEDPALSIYVALKDDYRWDQGCSIDAVGDHFGSEVSEGCYDSDLTVDGTRNTLNKIGLVEDDAFGQHIWDCTYHDAGGNYGAWHKSTGETSQNKRSLDEDGDLTNEDPSKFVFAVILADDDDLPDTVVLFRKDYWEANKHWDDSGDVPEWLDMMGFSDMATSVYEHNSGDIDAARQALIYKGVEELPEILMDKDAIKDYGWKPNAIGSRAKIEKEEEKVNPEDYYFAILPPGFHSDETTTILGQETFIVTMPKVEFDAGKKPLVDGGWFTEEELDKFEWDETEPSVYSMDMNVGDAYRLITQGGATENGKLLLAMGLDFNIIPFDWPYHYKVNGDRKTRNEIQMEAVRILEIAREKGIILSDDDGEITVTTMGIDQEAIAPEQEDISKAFRKTLGLNEKSTDPELIIKVIFDEAIKQTIQTIEDNNLVVDDLGLNDDIKSLINTRLEVINAKPDPSKWEVETDYDVVTKDLVTKEEAIKILGLENTANPKDALRKRLKRGTTCKVETVDGVDFVKIIKEETTVEAEADEPEVSGNAWGTRKQISDGSDYYFQLEDPTDPNAAAWAQDTTMVEMMMGKGHVHCQIVICPKAHFEDEGSILDQHMSDSAGGPLHLPEEFDEMMEAMFVYHGPAATARKYLENMGMEEKVMV